ncbi:MAG: hypothetical protein CR986_07435 [Ignavibacteriae bacterium]|nr:MAG: hypothetical protein CR986_07435 [Ignavibacteriota bacterium]
MSIPNIFLMPGLGFDYRVFSNLDLKNCNINYLDWLEPNKEETLASYVERVEKQITFNNKPIILIGHSFGGIIVQEIANKNDVEKVIIISSIKSKDEIPLNLKFLKVFPVYKFLNKKLILKSFPIWARLFGYNSEKGRKLYNLMLDNCTNNYLRWSLEKISHWEENYNLKNLVHIHGTNDKTFSIKLIDRPIKVKDGSHFMVFSRSEEVSEILNKEIENSL